MTLLHRAIADRPDISRLAEGLWLLLVTAYATCGAISIGTVYQTGYAAWAGYEQWDLPTLLTLIGIAWPFQLLAVILTRRWVPIGVTRGAYSYAAMIALSAAMACLFAVGSVLAADLLLAQQSPVARFQSLVGIESNPEKILRPDSVEVLYAATCLLPIVMSLSVSIARWLAPMLPRLVSVIDSVKGIAVRGWRRARTDVTADSSGARMEHRGDRLGRSARAFLWAALLLLLGLLGQAVAAAYGLAFAGAHVALVHVGIFLLVLALHQSLFKRDEDAAQRRAVNYALASLVIVTFILTLPSERTFPRMGAWSPADIPQDIATWVAHSGVGVLVVGGVLIAAAWRVLATLRLLLGRALFPQFSVMRQWSLVLAATVAAAGIYGFLVYAHLMAERRIEELQRIMGSAKTRERGQALAETVFQQGVRANLRLSNNRSPLLEVCKDAWESQVIPAVPRYIAAELLRRGADPNGYLGNRTPLADAIHSDDPRLVRLLLEAGARVDRPSGNSVLRTAWQAKDPESYRDYELPLLIAAKDDEEGRIVSALLEAGADVNQRAAGNSTPLHLARSIAAAQLLLAAGADIHAKDRNGDAPIDRAADRDDAAVVEFLQTQGATLREDRGQRY